MKKVLQVLSSLGGGGAEKIAILIANELANESNNIHSYLLTLREYPKDYEYLIDKNVHFSTVKRQKLLDFKSLIKLRKFVKNNNIDVIQAHNKSIFFVMIASFNLNVRVIWHDNFGQTNTKLYKRNKLIYNFLLNKLDHYIGVNSSLIKWAININKKVKATFLPNFSSNYSNNYSLDFPLPGNKENRIVLVGNFKPQKDHLNAIKAFLRVIEEFPDMHLIFMGSVIDRNYFNKIQEKINSNKLYNNVHIIKASKYPEIVMRKSTIAILSSNSEGLPLALIEYGLNKLPVVVTDVGECANVVANKVDGIVVPPRDSVKLGEALKNLINNKDIKSYYSKNFYLKVLNNYSKESVIRSLLEIY
jgi:glycosyltransferase involved in cell wall biosynthesis